jgi:hypothetical protein
MLLIMFRIEKYALCIFRTVSTGWNTAHFTGQQLRLRTLKIDVARWRQASIRVTQQFENDTGLPFIVLSAWLSRDFGAECLLPPTKQEVTTILCLLAESSNSLLVFIALACWQTLSYPLARSSLYTVVFAGPKEERLE